MKKGFKQHIEQAAIENTDFRKVLYTGSHVQLVLMSLRPGEDIGTEVHAENDQFFRFEQGHGSVVINGITYHVADGDAVIVPSGAEHNVINTGPDDLKLYTLYAPAHHKDGVIRHTKQEAEADAPEFDGVTSE